MVSGPIRATSQTACSATQKDGVASPCRISRLSMDRTLALVDRRRSMRGLPQGEPGRPDLVSMILGCYREMPGLCLRAEQAGRLFGVSVRTCTVVLRDLVHQGRLRVDGERQYRLVVDPGDSSNS